jgi:hypothetical protein
LNTLLYALIYNLFGLNAFIFHLVCIFIHLGNSLLVFLLIFRLNSINKSWEINNEHQKIVCLYSCFFVALMFGISPMQIESVAWISASKILLYSFFFLLSILVYLNFIKTKKYGYLVLSLFLYALAILSKEQAVVLPAILLLVNYFILDRSEVKKYVYLLPFFLIAIISGILSLLIQDEGFSKMLNNYYPLWQRIFLASYSLTQYVVKITMPLRQWLFYPFPIKPGDSLPNLYLIYPFIVTFLFFLLYNCFRKGKKIIVFGFGFFFINLALTLHLVPLGRLSVLADRYTYLSSIGLFFIISDYLATAFDGYKNKRILLALAVLLYVGLNYYKSIYYIIQWDDYWIKLQQ